MKPKAVLIIGVAFVGLLALLVLAGPALVELASGPAQPPPAQPLRRPPPVAVALPPDAVDAGERTPAPAPAPLVEVRPPVKPAPPPAPAPKPEVQGYLTLLVRPSPVTVEYRGKVLGKTPLNHQAFPAGKLSLALVDGKGKRKLLAVTLRPDKELKAQVNWDKLR